MNDDCILLSFPHGLIGFPELNRLRLFEPADAYPLKFLQCEDKPEVSFIALDVATLKPDYHVPLAAAEAEALALENEADAMVLTMVSIPPGDPQGMTTNLAGPLIINTRTRVGRQIALNVEAYPLKYPVLGAP